MTHTFPTYSLQTVVKKLQILYNALEEPQSNIELTSAVTTIGYNSTINGAARYFLSSAQQYGLVKYDTKQYMFNFTELAHGVFKFNFEAMKKAAFTPPLFSDLNKYFEGDLNVFRPTVFSLGKRYELDSRNSQALSNSYCTTLTYLRELKPSGKLGERKSIHSKDGRVSVFYHTPETLIDDIKELCSNIH
jgi:hypothetical protein